MNIFTKTFSVLVLFFTVVANAKDIYVAKNGNDSNPGTLTQPYLTINKAASVAVAGDVVYIREGIYEEILTPARSGSSGNPIVYTGYQNEKVVISAMEKVNGFTLDSGSIYKKTLNWDLGQRMFLLNENTLMDLARWPNNIDGDRYTIDSKRSEGGSDTNSRATGHLLNSEIPNFPWENGGTLWFYGDRPGSGWTSWKFPITGSSAGRVDWRNTHSTNTYWVVGFHPPKDGGDFFLEGIKEALDYQNEWYFDSTTKELFVQLPSGLAPSEGSIQVSRRENAININNKSFIEIRNIAVFGGSIIMRGNNNRLFQVSSFYGGMTRGSNANGIFSGTASVSIPWASIKFTNNIIEKCEIAYADGTGLFNAGTGTFTANNYIHDCGYLGNYDAPILYRGGVGGKITNNTIRKGGRDCVQVINKNAEIAWNDVSESNQIADDCGTFYYSGSGDTATAAANPVGTIIHHNWFHDAQGRGKLKKAAGIYLDTNPNKFDVYNNVVWNVEWTGVQMNWNALDINVYNNTFMKTQGGAMGAWHKSDTAFSNVKVWNNIADEGRIDDPNTQENEGTFEEQSDRQNNIITQVGFVNYTGNNFELTASSPAVDAGRLIPGFTDDFQGVAPDIGAYELGVPVWKPGVDWNIQAGPRGICYDLPGEPCALGITPKLITVKSVGEKCPNSDNGEIVTSISENSLYTITVKDNSGIVVKTESFSNFYTVGGLAPGSYEVCYTTDAIPDFNRCFDIIVAESPSMEASAKVIEDTNQVTVSLAGASNYSITLNGEEFSTSASSITLDLQNGENQLEVKTDKDCQGTFSEKIFIDPNELKAYPVPSVSTVTFEKNSFANESVGIEFYSMTGELVKSENYTNTEMISLDISTLNSGIYLVKIDSGSEQIISKIIKK